MSFLVEYGKDETKCLRCDNVLEPNELRIGYCFSTGKKKVWFHVTCFKVPSKLKEWKMLQGLDDLEDFDKKQILSMVTENSESKKRKHSKRRESNKRSTKKQKQDASNEVSSLKQDLKNKTLKQLQSLLRINNQLLSGTKEELVERVFDRMTKGAVPKCPQCKIGHLHPVENPLVRIQESLKQKSAHATNNKNIDDTKDNNSERGQQSDNLKSLCGSLSEPPKGADGKPLGNCFSTLGIIYNHLHRMPYLLNSFLMTE
jgi:hypothetical protein